MLMKKTLLSLLVGILALWVSSAHQPRLVFTQPVGQIVHIQNPEISQAFYGILSGQKDTYQITAETGFLLYVSLVVPNISGQNTDFIVYIMEGDDAIYTWLQGKDVIWTNFFEPFGGDEYLQWPQREHNMGPGTYTIIVTNASNQGKYSLAIGKKESFPLGEIVQTYRNMPTLKTVFFQKPRYLTYWSYVGAFGGIILVISGGICYIGIRRLQRLRRG